MLKPPRPVLFRFLNLVIRLIPVSEKYYGNSILCSKTLAEVAPVSVPPPYRSKWAGSEEIALMNDHPEAEQRGVYEQRVARGDRCVCLLEAEELIGYQWMAFESARNFGEDLPGWEMMFLPLSSTHAYLYDLFVYQKYRGRRLGPLIRTLGFAGLKELGYQVALSVVDVHNEPALRLRDKTNEDLLQLAYCYQIGKWRHCFFGRAEDPRLKRWWDEFRARPAHRPTSAH